MIWSSCTTGSAEAWLHVHLFTAPPVQPMRDDVVDVQYDGAVLQHALARLDAKRGAAGGPTKWTYEQILAKTKSSTKAFQCALAFTSLILSNEPPRHYSLLDDTPLLHWRNMTVLGARSVWVEYAIASLGCVP